MSHNHEQEMQRLDLYLSQRSKVSGECLIWTGSKGEKYGQANWDDTTISAHVLAYMFYHDMDLPRKNKDGEKLVVRHLCLPKLCIADDHLVIGTHWDNSNDMKKSGTRLFGENHPSATISEETAKQIIASKLERSDPNYKTAQQRADKFNTSINVVYGIDHKATWIHLLCSSQPSKHRSLKRQTTNTTEYGNGKITEAQAKLVISSRLHIYDPEHKTQDERAQALGISIYIIQQIDTMGSWQYLPRPIIQVFPKPPPLWDIETIKTAFERVKEKCEYNDFVNEFMSTPCLEWKGTLKEGRPYMKVFNISQPAYVYSCQYAAGHEKPKGLQVRHLCDNRICCEPTHLKFGTQLENGGDQKVHATNKGFKLNFQKAEEIKQLYLQENMSKDDLAKKYNVGWTAIHNIVTGRSWTPVPIVV